MAAKMQGKGSGTALGARLAAVVGVLLALVVGGAVAATLALGDANVRERASKELERNNSAHAVLQQQRYRQLETLAQVLDNDEALAELLVANPVDPVAILARLEEIRDGSGLAVVLALDADGRLLARTDSPDAHGDDLASDPLISNALAQNDPASGVWRLGEGLVYARVSQLVRDFERIGLIGLAFDLVPVVDELKRATGAEITVLQRTSTGPATVATTLAPEIAQDVVDALRIEGQALGNVLERGRAAPDVEIEIGEAPWMAFLAPLRGGESTVAALVALEPVGDRLAAFRGVRWALYGLGSIALLLASGAAVVLSRRAFAPLGDLTAAVGAAARGADVELPAKGAFKGLAGSLGDLLGQARDQRELQGFLGQRARALPEPSKSEAGEPPRARQLALVGVEMRRYANPKIGYDPEEHLGRYARDLQRIQSMAAASKGTVEALLGHRLLLSFEGDNAALDALRAATEIQIALSQRENAFDEPVPPLVGVSVGSAASAAMAWEGRSAVAIAGMPIQDLEGLLREATADAIFLSRGAAEALLPLFRQAGIEPKGQRSVINQQPLYHVGAMLAAQLTDAQPQTPTAQGANTTRPLAEVTPGAVLEGRFEVLAELGIGRLGRTVKVQDRSTSQLLALKLLRPELTADEARMRRLEEVARKVQLLEHPGLPNLLDFGRLDGLVSAASELVRGMTLRWMLSSGGLMPPLESVLLARRIADALDAAHRGGVVHGGLKPENILVEPNGATYILDLGLSAAVGDTGEAHDPGAQYLAPEQLEGRELAPQADIWALGAVLYEMLTGAAPFPGGGRPDVRERLAAGPPAPPSTRAKVPAELESVVLACLAMEPAGRPASGGALREALDAVPDAVLRV